MNPDAGIPDLSRRLGDDSKRLMQDEVRLARLELRDGIDRAGRGAATFAEPSYTLEATRETIGENVGWVRQARD